MFRNAQVTRNLTLSVPSAILAGNRAAVRDATAAFAGEYARDYAVGPGVAFAGNHLSGLANEALEVASAALPGGGTIMGAFQAYELCFNP